MKASTKLRINTDEVILDETDTTQLDLNLEPTQGQYTFKAFSN